MFKVLLMVGFFIFASPDAQGFYLAYGAENHKMYGRHFSNGRSIMLGKDVFEGANLKLIFQSTYIRTQISDHYKTHLLGLDTTLRFFINPYNFYAGASAGLNEIYLEYKELDNSYSKKLYPGYGFHLGYQESSVFAELAFRRINNLNLRYHKYYEDKSYDGFSLVVGVKI